MINKTFLAAAAIGTALLGVQASPTHADAIIQFQFGVPGGGVSIGSGGGGHSSHRDRISCREARREVRSNGFRDIDTGDCQGDSYKFYGWRDGSRWRIKVDAYSGNITQARRY